MNAGTYTGEAVQRPPALVRDQVAAQLRAAISNGDLLPGEVLVERELCDATTASRASVREALRLLESEGLVTSASGKGSVVTTLTAQQAREIYEIRSALEGLAGRLFAERATEEDREALKAALAGIEKAAPDIKAVLHAKSHFYTALMRGAENFELRHILESVNRRATAVRAVSLSHPGRLTESIAEIRQICEAATSGDAERAEELCRKHIQNAADAGMQGFTK